MTLNHPSLGPLRFRSTCSDADRETLVLVDRDGTELADLRPLAPGECAVSLDGGQPQCRADAYGSWQLSAFDTGGCCIESRVLFAEPESDETEGLATPGVAAWAAISLTFAMGSEAPGRG
jgi:hypothetical protein